MLSTPRRSVARVFDALVLGRDHCEADRFVLRQILGHAPEALLTAKELRHWLVRTVRFLADRIGIDQFLDLGSGFAPSDNTHQVAQRYNPEAHVVYVDSRPPGRSRERAVIEEAHYTHFAGYDLTRPHETLADPALARQLDLSRPVGLIMCAIIHHIEDLQQAQEIVRSYVGELALGSYLVLAHQFDPGDSREPSSAARSARERFRGTGLDTLHRSRDEIASFFEGLELVEPGLTFPHEWWPDGPRSAPLSNANFTTLGGVARVP